MPGVGIGIIIFNEDGKVLLIKRNDDANLADSDMRLEGTWTLPAGKVMLGETIFEAAKRKALSEVNLKIDDLSIVSIADDINEHAHFVTFGVFAEKCSGIVDLGTTQEHIDYKYYGLDELPENLCEPSKKILRNYLNKEMYIEGEKYE